MAHLTDFMLIVPLGPQLLRTLDLPLAALGQLVFAYTVSAGVSGVALGALIHRFERRALLMAVFGGFAAALLLTLAARSFDALVLARVLAGVCGGVLSSLIQATVAEVVPLERRAAAIGTVATGHSLASVIGVPLGLAIASAFDWRLSFAALLLLALPVLAGLARRVPRWGDIRRRCRCSRFRSPGASHARAESEIGQRRVQAGLETVRAATRACSCGHEPTPNRRFGSSSASPRPCSISA